MRMIMLKRRETVTFLGDFGVGVWVWVWVLGVVLVVLFFIFPTFHLFSFYVALFHSSFFLNLFFLRLPFTLISGLWSLLPSPSFPPKLLLRGELL